MKKARKFINLILAVVMAMSLSMTAWADENAQHEITIINATDGYTYKAYQVFKGDYILKDEKDVLTNIEWGEGVEDAGLLEELKNIAITGENEENVYIFEDCETADDVAEVLTQNPEVVKDFAAVVANYLIADKAKPSTQGEGVYTISVIGDGYYLVKNTDIPNDSTDTFYSDYILEVVKDVEVSPKGDVPTATKEIVIDNDSTAAINTASIGDTINYKITGTLPNNISDYNTYYYVFTDTLSEGLTYDEDNEETEIKILVNGEDVSEYFYVNVGEYNSESGTLITIGIQDLLELENLTSPEITIDDETEVIITYSATLNENAVIGGKIGNTNDVVLEYYNDPNNSGEGRSEEIPDPDPDKEPDPEDDSPTGETPEQKVTTYVTELTITKIDGSSDAEEPSILTGAAFKITSDDSTNIVVTTGKMFVESDTGEYYKLTDGTYTKTAPTESTKDNYYDDGETRYSCEDNLSEKELINTKEGYVAEAFVGNDGTLTFSGLGEGTYTITEVVTPDGYNSIDPITFEITFDTEKMEFISSIEDVVIVGDDNKLDAGIVNNSGSELPSTGGIGTTIFYVAGGILVLIAVVLLVTKKRMKAEE